MSTPMRAKVRVSNIQTFNDAQGGITSQRLTFNAVCKDAGYPADGSDEDNTFAKWTPSAEFGLSVTNPALFDKFEIGEKYYVDFTPAVTPAG